MAKTLDLFSGIGGFAHALRGVCQTVAFCEIDAGCRRVLERLQERRLLDAAPVLVDVRAVRRQDLDVDMPVMITAGSPCQDISSCNPAGKGVEGLKSSLVFEVLRLASELETVRVVLLENSEQLRHKGLDAVVAAFEAKGFRCVWRVFSAKYVGALHRRNRMFVLAYKPDVETAALLSTMAVPEANYHPVWADTANVEPVPRLALKTSQRNERFRRHMMLGNSVVSQCVAKAFDELRRAVVEPGFVPLKQPRYAVPLDLGLILHNEERDKTASKPIWSTPVRSVWHQFRDMNRRSLTCFANQVYFERGSMGTVAAHPATVTSSMRSSLYDVNVEFVEWLMGYPLGWTCVD
jgi:site-specific DNA-cytosine methylase